VSDDYVRQRLSQAMDGLAVSKQNLQCRLAAAGRALLVLRDDDFTDDDDRASFRQIIDVLTRYGAGGEIGNVETSAIELDDEAALKVAQQIHDLHARYFPLYVEPATRTPRQLEEDDARTIFEVMMEFARLMGFDPAASEVRAAGRAALKSAGGDDDGRPEPGEHH